ncbi:hypothetical protein Gpo141_00009917 [Globisporangium polare]
MGVSFFRVGDNVELWRVTEYLCLLVAAVMLFEQALHKAEHAAHKYPKYHEMLSKVYRELMVLGLIGLGVKLIKETSFVNPDGKNMLAFQVADLAIFILALALIIQSICVFSLLGSTNKEMDRNELVSTDDLLEVVIQHQRAVQNQSCFRNLWPWGGSQLAAQYGVKGRKFAFSSAKYDDMVTMRTLRHYFLRRYKLPQLFPFAKYLRHAQDNQIQHMIDVEISAWILLVLLAWGLDGATELLEKWNHEAERYAVVSIFLVFSWALTLLHIAVLRYLISAKNKIRSTAGYRTRVHMTETLKNLSAEEVLLSDHERAADPVEIMQGVQDRQEGVQLKKEKSYYFKHDTGLQVIEGFCKGVAASCCRVAKYRDLKEEHRLDAENGLQLLEREPEGLPPLPHVQIFGFSRKGLHFVVKFLLMLNGFYLALMCQCILWEMGEVWRVFGPLLACSVPLPLIINMLIFQPRICRNFILVSSIFLVDVTTLSEVITQFSESMELRSDFVACLTRTMKENGQTVADLHHDFLEKDHGKTGLIELEELRIVLRKFGCQVSYFRFNGIAKLLFRLKGTKVEYEQVERLVKLAEEEDLRSSSIAIAEGRPSSMFNQNENRYRQTVLAEESAAQRGLQSSFVSVSDTFDRHRPENRKILQMRNKHLAGGQQPPSLPQYPAESPGGIYVPGNSHHGPSPMLSNTSAAGSQYRPL